MLDCICNNLYILPNHILRQFANLTTAFNHINNPLSFVTGERLISLYALFIYIRNDLSMLGQ